MSRHIGAYCIECKNRENKQCKLGYDYRFDLHKCDDFDPNDGYIPYIIIQDAYDIGDLITTESRREEK